MKLNHSYLLPGAHDTEDILKIMGSKVEVTVNFSDRHMPIDGHRPSRSFSHFFSVLLVQCLFSPLWWIKRLLLLT